MLADSRGKGSEWALVEGILGIQQDDILQCIEHKMAMHDMAVISILCISRVLLNLGMG